MKNDLWVDRNEVDVGFGKPIQLSSKAAAVENASQLLPAGHGWVGDFSFHSDLEENPFVIIDLKAVRFLTRLRVFNRDSVPERAIPLAISVSLDGTSWSELCRINYVFGGRTVGDPLHLCFHGGLQARYVKLQVHNTTFFHLDYVEILARLPVLPLGRLQNVNASGQHILAEYSHQISYGFTWTFTITLKAIIDCRLYDVIVSRVDYSLCMAPFKDRPDADPYAALFTPEPISERFEGLAHVNFDHHGVYVAANLSELNKYATLYFSPSAAVRSFEAELIRKYQLKPGQTIALIFRGTDKTSEVQPTPIEDYIKIALTARRAQPNLQIIIQTDQEQALAAVLEAIPDAIFFREMPLTSGTTVMHQLALEDQFEISKETFAIRMLAVIHLLSGMKFVVTHTGNTGFWLACYRGHSHGFYQFDTGKKLRGPDAEIIEDVDRIEWS